MTVNILTKETKCPQKFKREIKVNLLAEQYSWKTILYQQRHYLSSNNGVNNEYKIKYKEVACQTEFHNVSSQ